MKKKFVRTDSSRFSKIGKRRKKLQKWRRAKGRDNKIREKRHGYPRSPAVGYKTSKKESGKIGGSLPFLVYNLNDLQNIDGKKQVVIIGSVGAKKKLEIIKKAKEMSLKIVNVQGGRS